jgi:hypothetical protein
MARARVLVAGAIVVFVGFGASLRLAGGHDTSTKAGAEGTTTSAAPAPPTTRGVMPFALGDRIESGGLRLVLDAVTDPFESTDPIVTPPADRRWVATKIDVTNVSGQPMTIDGTEFSLLDGNGLRFHLADTAEHLPSVDGPLQPGDTRRATLIFETPQGARDLQLSYDRLTGRAAPMLVALG